MATILDRVFSRKAGRQTDVVLGAYVSAGRSYPITEKSIGAGSALQMVERMRELRPDSYGLALAYATNPIAYRCVELRASKVAEMPWFLHRRDGQVIDRHPFFGALKMAQSYFNKPLFAAWEMSLCIHGETYIEKVYDIANRPAGLRWLNPLAIEPLIDARGIAGFMYNGVTKTTQFKAHEVIYHYLHNPLDDYRGLGPMALAMNAINTHNSVQQYSKAFFQNNAQPGGILSARAGTVIQKADQDRLLQQWREQVGGPLNARKTIFMPAALEFQPVQEPPNRSNVDVERSAARQICEVFGVPYVIIDVDDLAYKMDDEPMKLLYENTIIPRCKQIATVVNEQILPFFGDDDVVFEYDFDQIRSMLDDQMRRANSINSRLLSGNLTINEARRRFGDPPVDGGDTFLLPTALQPASIDGLRATIDRLIADRFADQTDARSGLTARQENRDIRDGQGVDPASGMLRELRAWRKKAINRGVRKARDFVAEVLPVAIAERIRADLYELPDDAGPEEVKEVFALAAAELKVILDRQEIERLAEALGQRTDLDWLGATAVTEAN